MEEDWSSAYFFRNFPKRKKVLCVWSDLKCRYCAFTLWVRVAATEKRIIFYYFLSCILVDVSLNCPLLFLCWKSNIIIDQRLWIFCSLDKNQNEHRLCRLHVRTRFVRYFGIVVEHTRFSPSKPGHFGLEGTLSYICNEIFIHKIRLYIMLIQNNYRPVGNITSNESFIPYSHQYQQWKYSAKNPPGDTAVSRDGKFLTKIMLLLLKANGSETERHHRCHHMLVSLW